MSQDSIHRPQLSKRKVSQVESTWGPSAYQPNALLLGQTGSQNKPNSKQTFLPEACSQGKEEAAEEGQLCVGDVVADDRQEPASRQIGVVSEMAVKISICRGCQG